MKLYSSQVNRKLINFIKLNKQKLYLCTSFLLLMFLAFSFFFKTDLSFNQDLGRHLKLGEIIWETKNIPKTNLFSYTNPNFPFINHHWLFEVIIYLGSILVGLQAILIGKLFLLLLIVALTLVFAMRSKSILFLPISFIFIHLFRGRSELRPEIFSYLFTIITLFILEEFDKKNSKIIFILPLISLIWVNMHIYFPVVIMIQIFYLANLLFEKFANKPKKVELNNKIKTLGIVIGLSVIATVFNPNTIKGAIYPFTVFNNYGVTITENQTVFTLQKISFVDPDFLFFYLSAIILVTSIIFCIYKKKYSFKNIILSLLGLVFALQSIRGFPYLALISLSFVLLNFGNIKNNNWIKLLNIAVGMIIIFEGIFYLSGKYYENTYDQHLPTLSFVEDGLPAANFIIKNNLPSPIFNNFDIGSYLIYKLNPNYEVYIDGRPEAYPASFFTNEYLPMQENYKLFEKEEKDNNFRTVVFSITDQNPRTINFLNKITHDPDWKVVFLDQYMIVLVRNEEQTKLGLKPIDLNKADPNNYVYSKAMPYTNLSNLFLNLHYYKTAQKFNQKALDINPKNPGANKIMAFILYFQKRNKGLVESYLNSSTNQVFW